MTSVAMLACLLLAIGGGISFTLEGAARSTEEATPRSRRVRGLRIGIVVAAFLLTVVTLLSIGSISITQPLTQAVCLAGLSTLLVGGLLASERTSLARLSWNSGLLVLAAGDHPWLWWLAVSLTMVSKLAFAEGGNRSQWSPLYWVSSLLWTVGFLVWAIPLGFEVATHFAAVLVLAGLGGQLGWFPFPRVQQFDGKGNSEIAGETLLPCLTAGVVLRQLLLSHPLDESALMTLATMTMFALGAASLRMLREEHLSRRLALVSLTTLSVLCLAALLAGWEAGSPRADWAVTSNLLTGEELFLSILLCETAAWLLVAGGTAWLSSGTDGVDFEETLAGAAVRRPIASLPLMAGTLSLAGVPPFPGFFWRCGLLASLVLPYRVSQWTSLTEPHRGFWVVAVAAAVCFVLIALAHLKLFARLTFEEPFRHRGVQRRWNTGMAVLAALVLFAGVAVRPLSVVSGADEEEVVIGEIGDRRENAL